LDLAFADVVATSTDPQLGAIRLAWWRERLEELDKGALPAEPRLQSVAEELIARGISGAELSMLEDAWLPMLQPFPWAAAQAQGLRDRGRLLFTVGALLLGGADASAGPAGELWSLRDGAVHCSDPQSRAMLGHATEAAVRLLPVQVPGVLRPLTVLAALAAADILRAGALTRGASALKHRLTGRFPR
jgi:phytoene synthase